MATQVAVNIKIKSAVGATNSTASIYCPPPAVVATTLTLDGATLTAPVANYGVLRVSTPVTFVSSPRDESDIQNLILYNDGGTTITLTSFDFTCSLVKSRVIIPKFYGTVAQSLISGTNVTLLAGTTASFLISYTAIAPGEYINSLVFFSNAQNPEYQVNTYQSISNDENIVASNSTFVTYTTILGQTNSTDIILNKRTNGVTYTGTNLTFNTSISGDPGWSVTTGTVNTIHIVWNPDLVNNNTGTYRSTLTVSVSESGQFLGTKTITNISYVDIDYLKYNNLASWVSPASSYNSIIGMSLDTINDQRILTIGVGMGGDYASRYDQGGYNLVDVNNLSYRARSSNLKFPYWANVWSFVLTEYSYTYLSGSLDNDIVPNYIRKTTEGYNYEQYFGYEQSPGYKSMFIVNHDGRGNITIALNNLRELSGNAEFDATLKNLTRALYYYSNSDINGRYSQLNSGPLGDGTRTLLFRGFDSLVPTLSSSLPTIVPNGVTVDSSSWAFNNNSPALDYYELTSTTTNDYNLGPGRCTFEFTFKSTNYFAQNPGGHFSVVVRCNNAAIANGYVQGQGMIIGNVSAAPTPVTPPLPPGVPFNPNPVYPSTQIESFWAGIVSHDFDTTIYYGNTLLANTNGANPVLVDGVEYKFIVTSEISASLKSYTGYTILQGTTVVYNQPLVYDYNIYYNPTKSGIVIAHVFENATASAWSVAVSNKVITWAPIRTVSMLPTAVITTATAIVTLPTNIL